MTTQKAARASPELRRAPLSPRYRRNYTTPRGTTSVIDARAKRALSYAITAQLIRYDDPRCAPTLYDFPQKPLGGFCVSARLHKDFERVSVAIDCTPEPVLLAVNLDHNFIQVPLVGGLGAITPDLAAICVPNFVTQTRIASWLTVMPRSASKSSMSRRPRAKRW